MKDTNNKTDKNKEEHCYYSGLPSPMAYIKEEDGDGEELDKLDKEEKQNNKQKNKYKTIK